MHRGQLCRGRGREYGHGPGFSRPQQRHDRVHYSDCQEPDPDVCDIFLSEHGTTVLHSIHGRIV